MKRTRLPNILYGLAERGGFPVHTGEEGYEDDRGENGTSRVSASTCKEGQGYRAGGLSRRHAKSTIRETVVIDGKTNPETAWRRWWARKTHAKAAPRTSESRLEI